MATICQCYWTLHKSFPSVPVSTNLKEVVLWLPRLSGPATWQSLRFYRLVRCRLSIIRFFKAVMVSSCSHEISYRCRPHFTASLTAYPFGANNWSYVFLFQAICLFPSLQYAFFNEGSWAAGTSSQSCDCLYPKGLDVELFFYSWSILPKNAPCLSETIPCLLSITDGWVGFL
jgi:hypothetical protein